MKRFHLFALTCACVALSGWSANAQPFGAPQTCPGGRCPRRATRRRPNSFRSPRRRRNPCLPTRRPRSGWPVLAIE